MFDKTPDILITPSDLVLFAKNIDGCICVNPGTVCKGLGGGSYASITVDPIAVPQNVREPEKTLFSNRASDRVRVDIINI